MSLYLLLLLAIVILLFYIKKKVTDVHAMVEEKIETVKEFISHPKSVAETIGAAVADVALTQTQNLIKRSQGKK